MKGKLRIMLSLALALLLALCLLSACGDTGSDKASDSGGDLADDNGVVGLWESEEWGGICLELLDDGTGTMYTYSDMGDITYSWDGEVLTLMNENEDGEPEEITGELQKDGSIGIMGLGYFFPVEERSYGPDMDGSSFMEAGGMESELEGDWIHTSGNRMLTFDGSGSLTFQEMYEGGSSSSSSGWYSYDGETVTVDTSAGISEGYIDDEGDLIIEIDGEGGWYSRGDSHINPPPSSKSRPLRRLTRGAWARRVSPKMIHTAPQSIRMTPNSEILKSKYRHIGFTSPSSVFVCGSVPGPGRKRLCFLHVI